jgi:hypothetical protein
MNTDNKYEISKICRGIFIKTLSDLIYQIPANWKYVKLFSNDLYEISISAECGHVDMSNNFFLYSNDKYYIRVNNDIKFPEYILQNTFFKKIRIQYKNEFIELCPDTFNIMRRSAISSHIRILGLKQGFDVASGIASLRFQKNYPVHNDLMHITVSIASLLTMEIKTDLITDQRHDIKIRCYFDNLDMCSGALIKDSNENCIQSLNNSFIVTNFVQ